LSCVSAVRSWRNCSRNSASPAAAAVTRTVAEDFDADGHVDFVRVELPLARAISPAALVFAPGARAVAERDCSIVAPTAASQLPPREGFVWMRRSAWRLVVRFAALKAAPRGRCRAATVESNRLLCSAIALTRATLDVGRRDVFIKRPKLLAKRDPRHRRLSRGVRSVAFRDEDFSVSPAAAASPRPRPRRPSSRTASSLYACGIPSRA
jgi:hypothetical protein